MRIEVTVSEQGSTSGEFAPVMVSCPLLDLETNLDLNYSSLYKRFGIPNSVSLDLLFLASVVYVTDKMIPRSSAYDAWTREFSIIIPVENTRLFSDAQHKINACLSFLTGDIWQIQFESLSSNLVRPKRRRQRRRRHTRRVTNPAAVCLFSGGADSLTGAIDWLETNPDAGLLLVGHYDGDVSGPKSEQKALYSILTEAYPNRLELLQNRVGQKPKGEDSNFRSRSFLFLALGLLVSRECSNTMSLPLIMPENGTIALNIPLTPSRRGSCSTRTTHPYFIKCIQNISQQLGITNTIHNPLSNKTKGEIFSDCENIPLLYQAISKSCSCAKHGHRRNWIHMQATHCGICMPCVYRRAALHKIGRDNEEYGRDFCTGELDIEEHGCGSMANDVRACITFIRKGYSHQAIARMLLGNGRIPFEQIEQSADLVSRAMIEIRTLVRDKGNAMLKRNAGV